MRISHVSDSHGSIPNLKGSFDIIVHSGDLFPDNNYYKNKEGLSDKDFQLKWLRNKVNKFKGMTAGKPFLFTLGNHDFVDDVLVEAILREGGVDAYSLHNDIVVIDNFKFIGFPYIPYIYGDWNYERNTDQMRVEVNKLFNKIKDQHIDVLVAHCPPYGILDKTMGGENVGNRVLLDYMTYKLNREDTPEWYLCGHVHNSHGISCQGFFYTSNAATTKNIIELY